MHTKFDKKSLAIAWMMVIAGTFVATGLRAELHLDLSKLIE